MLWGPKRRKRGSGEGSPLEVIEPGLEGVLLGPASTSAAAVVGAAARRWRTVGSLGDGEA
jgi:hypothetical protein